MQINAEQKIIKVIKLVPVFVLVLSLFSIIVVTDGTQRSFDHELESFKQDAKDDEKQKIKGEVYRIHQFIEDERKLTTTRIKNNLKARTSEALAIAKSIYQKNKGKTKSEIVKRIKDALSDIRFNDGRGYYFIYESAGNSVMHPILTDIQGKNLWDFKDTKGTYVIRGLSQVANNQGEGYFTWWWTKPEDKQTEYKKIGYVEKFEPYDWFVGTGEYVLDYEEALKKRLLEHIGKIRFGKNGYIFIVDHEGFYLSHYKKSYIGENRLSLTDSQGFKITEEIIKRSAAEEGYISYIATISPETDMPSKKITFVKGYKSWRWAIGTGVYLSEINDAINIKKARLDKQRDAEFIQLLFIGAIISLLFIMASWIFANHIKRRFEHYKVSVEKKSLELSDLNVQLEEKVKARTLALEESLTELKLAQTKLIESEKMASLHGVVAGLAHEMNTPLGVMTTALSQLEDNINELSADISQRKLSLTRLDSYQVVSLQCLGLLNGNLNKSVSLVQNFKSLSTNKHGEMAKTFLISDAITLALNINADDISKLGITVNIEASQTLEITSFLNSLTEVLAQLIQNSCIHAFENKTGTNTIGLSIKAVEDKFIFEYKDNGIGLAEGDIDKVLEPFYTTKRNSKCTGLGLPIIYNHIVHMLDGKVIELSNRHCGFLISFELPKTTK